MKAIKGKLMFKFFILSMFCFSVAAFPQNGLEQKIPGLNIVSITQNGGSLWIATHGQGVIEYNQTTGEIKQYSTNNKNLTEDLFTSIAASDEYVWAGTVDGLMTLTKKDGKWRKRKFAEGGIYGNWVRDLAYDSYSGLLWIGRFINLTIFDVARNRYFDYNMTRNDDPYTNNIKTIRVEGDKFVWIGTEAGLFLYDKSLRKFEPQNLTFYSNRGRAFSPDGNQVSISDVIFDAEYVWVGADEFRSTDKPNFNTGGLYRFNRRAEWDRFDQYSGLPGDGIYAVSITGSFIWVTLYEFDKISREKFGRGFAVLQRDRGETVVSNPEEFSVGTRNITALFFDGNDMWLGTDNGLWKITIVNEFAKFSVERKSK